MCGACGVSCPPPYAVPAAELAPDLDGRPGEPARSTLQRWVTLCRNCGAAGPDLAALPDRAEEVVGWEAYRAEPSRFLRWAMIAQAAGRRDEAAEAVLQAAWLAEDEGADGSPLRLRAAAMWVGDPLRRVDVLRRAGAFAAAAEAAAAIEPEGEAAAQILAFERARIAAGDAARYAISSALRPPARSPHASHGRARPGPKPARGLLSRLFGR